jgi:hypothetical protein
LGFPDSKECYLLHTGLKAGLTRQQIRYYVSLPEFGSLRLLRERVCFFRMSGETEINKNKGLTGRKESQIEKLKGKRF